METPINIELMSEKTSITSNWLKHLLGISLETPCTALTIEAALQEYNKAGVASDAEMAAGIKVRELVLEKIKSLSLASEAEDLFNTLTDYRAFEALLIPLLDRWTTLCSMLPELNRLYANATSSETRKKIIRRMIVLVETANEKDALESLKLVNGDDDDAPVENEFKALVEKIAVCFFKETEAVPAM